MYEPKTEKTYLQVYTSIHILFSMGHCARGKRAMVLK